MRYSPPSFLSFLGFFLGAFFATVRVAAADASPVGKLSATDARRILRLGRHSRPGYWDSEGWDAPWLEGVVTSGTVEGWSAVKIETVGASRPTRLIKNPRKSPLTALARVTHGEGVALLFQLDPAANTVGNPHS